MRRSISGVALGCASVLACAAIVCADGHARVVVPFDLEAGEVAEGVAVDWEDNLYTGLSAQGRMLKILIDDGEVGEVVELATLEGLAEGDFGFVGHGFNSDGKLYSAVVSANPELNGLVAMDPETGAWSHVAGTEVMAMANALETDGWGTLYVSDTILGAVWRVQSNADVEVEPVVEMWVQDPLLEGTNELPYPFPIGANGVALRDGAVHVANTERASIVAIPIDHQDGSAGEPYVYAELPGIAPDGIAFDASGNLYVADPPAHTLWKVTPDGEVIAVADADDGLSGPSSVVLYDDSGGGSDPSEPGLTAYVSNQAIGPEGTIEHGPSIIAIALGE